MLTAELETATANIVFKPATFFPSVLLRALRALRGETRSTDTPRSTR